MKTKSTFAIIFFTRKSRSKTNTLSIYLRITISGNRSEMSLKRSVHSNQWDTTKNRGRGHSESIKILNAYLDEVYNKLLQCHKELLEEGKIMSAHAIKSRYLGEDDNSKTLKELITYHNDNMIHVLKAGTMKNYYTTERYLQKFLWKKRVKDIYLKQLNYRFITDFEHYLRTYKNSKKQLMLSNNGVMKHLERFKKMINLAIKLEWMQKNPFSKFQLKYNKFDRQYLSERELSILETTTFKTERLEKIKDCFVFSCYTGLSFIDVKELTKNNIVKGIDNTNWIYTKREKTDEQVKVPILPKAWAILEKYRIAQENDSITDNLLPISSNQKTNAYLKEIARACNIHKSISFHVARHTFATTVMLSNGVPIETVSKLLGHTKLSTTQIYARVIELKISEDIQNLLKRFETKKKNNY